MLPTHTTETPITHSLNLVYLANSFPIDLENLLQAHLSYNPASKTFSCYWTSQVKLREHHDTLKKILSKSLIVLQEGFPKIQASIVLSSHVLHKIEYDTEHRAGVHLSSDPLSSYDLRVLNQEGLSRIEKISTRHLQPIPKSFPADLHTHFGGVITVEMFKEVFREAKRQAISIFFPIAYLKEMGVLFTSTSSEDSVDLLASHVQIDEIKFFQSLALDSFGVTSFNAMEDVYKFRGPIVKNLKLFPIFLELIAKDYKKYGVQYVELSLSDILKPDWMRMTLECLPGIEKKYQITIRFLVGLWRHSPKEFNQDLIEQIKTYLSAGNPYIVGIDYMGQETNSTRDFIEELKILKKMKKDYPVFVIRVHGGESQCHPKNVFDAIKAGATRIGHGLYGLDEETLKLAKENNVIFECNPTSNHTLNNAPTEDESSIKKLLEAGIRVTVGTDGYGCYRTTPLLEASLVMQRGLTKEQMESIRISDLSYINKMIQFSTQINLKAVGRYLPILPKPKAPANIWDIAEERKIKAREEIVNTIQHRKIIYVNYDSLQDFFKRKDLMPLFFAGATSTSWDTPVPETDKTLLQKQIKDFLSHLNEKKVILITGGTDFGLEKLIHLAVEEFKKLGKDFMLLGTLASQLQADASKISSALTHATVINGSWYNLAPQILTAVSQSGGKAFFITGGDVVKEMIQISKNLSESQNKTTSLRPPFEYYLLKDVIGSPMTMTKVISDHDFSKNDQLATIVFDRSPEIISSLLLDDEEAIRHINSTIQKEIVTFLGYSKDYADSKALESQIEQKLLKCNPTTNLIIAGATFPGIGKVYPIAKKMGFETAGIVSSKARNSGMISPFVDFVFYINSEEWGGYLPVKDSDQEPILDPVSKVIVYTSNSAIRLGGGNIATIEAEELKKLGKTVFYTPMEKQENETHL